MKNGDMFKGEIEKPNELKKAWKMNRNKLKVKKRTTELLQKNELKTQKISDNAFFIHLLYILRDTRQQLIREKITQQSLKEKTLKKHLLA